MKKITILFASLVVISSLVIGAGCTQNQRARKFRGKTTINLDPNQKLLIASWKQDDLWILTKNMKADDVAETYTYEEKSSWGVLEGKIIFVEHKK